jgi:trk system potassium uptake protein TrkA
MAKPNGSGPSVFIMGCGRVGALLATHFHEQHYTVQVIDINAEAFKRISEKAIRERHTTVGDGTDPAVLRRAGLEAEDIFIAVTNGDNRNIMAAQIAKHQFNVGQVICRIYDPMRHAICRDHLGIQSICPTLIGRDAIITALTDGRANQKA